MKIWIDITNTPQVNVLLPVIKHLGSKHELIITARDFSETVPLLKKYGIQHTTIGEYKGKNRLMKVYGMAVRLVFLLFKLPSYDLALSWGGNYTAAISKIRGKKSVVFSDNDISYKGIAYKYADFFILPAGFITTKLVETYKVKPNQIKVFEGFKEDIYVADFQPNPDFLNEIPFKEFITIRPENLKASYVPSDSVTIVPQLFEALKEYNILFIPRYEEEKEYAKGFSNIYIAQKVLSGLDVCYYSSVMLTGAGTFAREAALLGTPAVSFFPGKVFLNVDEIMIEKAWMLKSRNVAEIAEYVKNAQKQNERTTRSKQVQKQVLGILDDIISQVK